MKSHNNDDHNPVIGCLLGLMTGDSIGLPYEGIKPKRQTRLLPSPLRHRLFFGHGMVSDDTEHMLMTAAALAQFWHRPDKFQTSLLWRLKWWFLRLPAGMGLATGKALIKAWCGFPIKKCGVFSAGNGPAMRAPLLGVCLGDEPEKMKTYTILSTELTHTDPKAVIGAIAVAQAAYLASTSPAVSFDDYVSDLNKLFVGLDSHAVDEFTQLLACIKNNLEEDEVSFAQTLNLRNGITGYMYHTVPMVLFTWMKNQGNYKKALEKIIAYGGDTDTTAAILGGICGAQSHGKDIPEDWINGIIDYPFNREYCTQASERLIECLHKNAPQKTPLLFGPFIFLRNAAFLLIVLFHGFRRLAPPY